jgi:hypothetical protein
MNLGLKYEVLKEGDFYEEATKEVSEQADKYVIKGTNVYKIFYDPEKKIALFLIGQGQSNKYLGFLAFQTEPLKFINFLKKEITMEFPLNLQFYGKGNCFLLSYWANKQTEEFKPTTEAYDVHTLQETKKYSNPLFRINEISCLINDRLFNGRFFDINNGEEIIVPGLSSGLVVYGIYDCKNGYALGRSSSTIKEPITLVLMDLNATTISKKEIKTDERIIGLNISNEWYLSRDAKYIIRDEQKEDGRTGRLVFIDIQDKKKTELKIVRKSPYGGGILGFSMSGRLLFYDSIDKLNVIDIQTHKVIKEIQLPFRPVGIIWP